MNRYATGRESAIAQTMALIMEAVSLTWKDESTLNGEAIGPLTLVGPDGTREALGWQTLAQATRVAEAFNKPLEVL